MQMIHHWDPSPYCLTETLHCMVRTDPSEDPDKRHYFIRDNTPIVSISIASSHSQRVHPILLHPFTSFSNIKACSRESSTDIVLAHQSAVKGFLHQAFSKETSIWCIIDQFQTSKSFETTLLQYEIMIYVQRILPLSPSSACEIPQTIENDVADDMHLSGSHLRGIQTRSMPDADPEQTGTDSSYTSLPIIMSMPCCANPGYLGHVTHAISLGRRNGSRNIYASSTKML